MNGTKMLKYDMVFMKDVANNYQSCSKKVQEIITELDHVKKQLLTSYEGHGADLAEDVFCKVRAHFELLDSLLIQTEQYVAYTKDTMRHLDQTQSGRISKKGGLPYGRFTK